MSITKLTAQSPPAAVDQSPLEEGMGHAPEVLSEQEMNDIFEGLSPNCNLDGGAYLSPLPSLLDNQGLVQTPTLPSLLDQGLHQSNMSMSGDYSNLGTQDFPINIDEDALFESMMISADQQQQLEELDEKDYYSPNFQYTGMQMGNGSMDYTFPSSRISQNQSQFQGSMSNNNNSWPTFDDMDIYTKLSSAQRDFAHHITNDPTKTKEEIKALLQNIRPDMDIPKEDREGTPDALKKNLMEHQKVGLTWLKRMEEGSNKGGILADDVGTLILITYPLLDT
jgi:hypothetical protein